MMREIAQLHIGALPHTWSSRRGVDFVANLYRIVGKIGYIKMINRDGRALGVVSGIGPLILTLAVEPAWQRKGVGKTLLSRLPQKLLVYTQEETTPFYEKQGFRRVAHIGKVVFLWRN